MATALTALEPVGEWWATFGVTERKARWERGGGGGGRGERALKWGRRGLVRPNIRLCSPGGKKERGDC